MNSLINPLARNGKVGWHDTFKNHASMCRKSANSKLVLFGDSIIANFDKCKDVFNNYFSSLHTLNFGISGDKIQNVLWRVENMTLPSSIEYVIIHCGTNNLGHNSPVKIAEGILNIATILNKSYKNLHILISCLLPRDKENSVKRSLVFAVNSYLKELCANTRFFYIDLDPGWTLEKYLNTELFRDDKLHLTTNGYKKLSKLFMNKIESIKKSEPCLNISSKTYSESVSFSTNKDDFPPLLSVYTPLHPQKYNSNNSQNVKYTTSNTGKTRQILNKIKPSLNVRKPVSLSVRKPVPMPNRNHKPLSVCKPVILHVRKSVIRKSVPLPVSKPVVSNTVTLRYRKPLVSKSVT